MGRTGRSHGATRWVGAEVLEARRLLAGRIDSLGTEFWLAFEPNDPAEVGTHGPAEKWLYLSARETAVAQVEVPALGFATSCTVVPGQVAAVALPNDAFATDSDGVSNMGIHVTADREVAIYGLSHQSYSTDGFVALPVDALGNSYRAISYAPINYMGLPSSQLAAVATEDQTTLIVTPSVAAGTHLAGVAYSVMLNRGQVYQLQSKNDLTGTLIAADKPVAAFSGDQVTRVPYVASGAADHLVEQLVPIERWGQEFVLKGVGSRPLPGAVYRLIVAEDDTQVRIDGGLWRTLNAGQYYDWVNVGAQSVETSKPAMLAEFATSNSYGGFPGDPFMALVPPVSQLQSEYTMPVLTDQFPAATGFRYNYLNLWAPAGTTISVDGEAIPASRFLPVGNGYVEAITSLTAGSHHITGSRPFGAMVYGLDYTDSYAFTGGWDFGADTVAPAVVSVVVNAGAGQRSMVKQVGVSFSEPVSLAAGAIAVKLSSGAAIPATLSISSADQQSYLLTFSGSGISGGSLADGIYDLIVSAAGVQDLAGNAMTGDYTQRFHRLFGDVDGNRVVNALDYAKLKATYGRASTDGLFNAALDYEGNGVINALDLAQFRKRYGLLYSY